MEALGRHLPRETPPRAWGRPSCYKNRWWLRGNTPTGVGKTLVDGGAIYVAQKHPHGRGEDRTSEMTPRATMETPPRAWGRPTNGLPVPDLRGNTPTGVGKTKFETIVARLEGKHPHGRGEDPGALDAHTAHLETPPRAWGRLGQAVQDGLEPGNTPTGVGKTRQACSRGLCPEKHPHGRGEDLAQPGRCPGKVETPPRAWGRRARQQDDRLIGRNTPTGVGKTPAAWRGNRPGRKHPHGRGEDQNAGDKDAFHVETPPRAWGRPSRDRGSGHALRNTPTGVGKTLYYLMRRPEMWKHPHGRGEDRHPCHAPASCLETPPRAWGRLLIQKGNARARRNTPTGVGKTLSRCAGYLPM